MDCGSEKPISLKAFWKRTHLSKHFFWVGQLFDGKHAWKYLYQNVPKSSRALLVSCAKYNVPPSEYSLSWRLRRGNSTLEVKKKMLSKSGTPPKTNMDTPNDGLENVFLLNIWLFLVSILNFWGVSFRYPAKKIQSVRSTRIFIRFASLFITLRLDVSGS